LQIVCRDTTGLQQTNRILSWIVLSCSHSLLQQHPVFVWWVGGGAW